MMSVAILLMAPMSCSVIGLILGYLRGFQQRYFRLRMHGMLVIILVGFAIFAYSQQEPILFILPAGIIILNYISLVLSMLIGSLIGYKLKRLPSWIAR